MRKPALKHFLLSFLLVFASYLLFAISPVRAQASNPYVAPVNNPDVPKNLHTYSQNAMIEVMSAMICQLSGVDPIQPDHQCLGIDPLNQRIGYIGKNQSGVAGGTIGSMSNLIASTFQLPVSSGHYFNYLAKSFGITKPSYGASDKTGGTTGSNTSANNTAITSGTGFDGLQPVLKIWTALRDLVYVLFVIGFVTVGVAVMLRIKIDPRTVMTIQNRIPKIIAALLLVTFSYAIAGFLIDFMWASIYLVINLFASVDPAIVKINGQPYTSLQVLYSNINDESLTSQNVLNYASNAIGILDTASDASRGVKDVVSSMLNNSAGFWISHFFGSAIGVGVGSGIGKLISAGASLLKLAPVVGTVSSVIGAIAGAAVGFAGADSITREVSGIVAFLILLVAILSALFRLWFKLLIAFVLFMLGVILAPLWIFAGILPGNKLGFGSWIRHMLSQMLIFPMTIGMFALGKVVIDGYKPVADGGTGFVPPLIGYGATQASITSLLALGLILITPNVAKWAGDIFKGPKLDATPIGQAVKAGSGTLTGGIKPISAALAPNQMLNKNPRQGVWGALRKMGFG